MKYKYKKVLITSKVMIIEQRFSNLREKIEKLEYTREPEKELAIEHLLYRISKNLVEVEEIVNKIEKENK